jgi:hypothetical protein
LTPGKRDPHHRSNWLRTVLLALFLATAVTSVTMAAPAASTAQPRRSSPARFSDLAELTPANVQRLLPLVSRGSGAKFDDQGTLPQQRPIAHGVQLDSLAGVDMRLQHFLDERVHLQVAIEEPARQPPLLGASACEISYVIGTRHDRWLVQGARCAYRPSPVEASGGRPRAQ